MATQLIVPDSWAAPLLEYRDWQRAGSSPPSTIKLRRYHMTRFAIEVGRPPFETEHDDLIAHLAARQWSPGTRRSVRTTLRSFYAWAAGTGRMAENPAAGLPQVTVPPGRPRPASDRAVDLGLADVDERVRLMVTLGAKAGLRCCEIAVVSTRDVVGDRGRFSLLVHGKGNKERYVPISDDLARQLLERPEGWTFPGQIDGHLSAGYVSKLISRAMAGLATAHPLRHRYATRTLRASGGNLRVVQELLGHASVATTQIYTLVEDDELRAAALAA